MSELDNLNNALNDNEPGNDKIKLGDKEYTQDELNHLVSLGQTAEELETKWNTKIDKVYPEYTKSQQRLKDLEKIEGEYNQLKQKQNQQITPNDQQLEEAKKVLREQFGVVFKDDLEGLGYVKKDEFPNLYRGEKAADMLLDETKDLEGEINGKDGRPAFKQDEILQYMVDTGIRNPELAYKTKYEKELDAWKEGQLGKIKDKGFTTNDKSNAGANREPPDVRPKNEDELIKHLEEALKGDLEE